MTALSGTDLRAELACVAQRFEDCLRSLGGTSRAISADPGIRPDNIALVLPYFLVEALPFDGDLPAARSMAIGNAFGAAHFLMQDRLLDGDEPLSPRALELSDRFLAEFVREYDGLDRLDGGFWDDLGRYLSEYFESLAWEANVLRAARGIEAVRDDGLPETLTRLGRRMAPLKSCGAAFARLSGRQDALPTVERFVESFHAGYQLADDIDDLGEDLDRGHWSVVAWIIHQSAGGRGLPSFPDAGAAFESAAATGALGRVIDLLRQQYRRALDHARSLGSPSLVDYMERIVARSSREYRRLARRLRLSFGSVTDAEGGGGRGADAGAQGRSSSPSTSPTALGEPQGRGLTTPPGVRAACLPAAGAGALSSVDGIHAFSVGDRSFVYDVASGLFFEADSLAMSLISWLEGGAEPVDLRVLEMDHGPEHVHEGLSEIALLRGSIDGAPGAFRAARDNALPPVVSSLALHLTGQCNLCCDYCYHGRGGRDAPPMSEQTAIRAVDLLFEESIGERNVSVVFFGGEPLLCPDMITRVVEHARAAADRARRRVSFHVTTNGTLLESDLASRLAELGISILVSIDGTPADHDRHRVFPDGRGSYHALAQRLASLPPGTRVGARATVTPESGPLREIVAHLAGLGCAVVHLAPVSDGEMAPRFSRRLRDEFEELARDELRRMLESGRPIVGNFAEALASLESGRARFLPCGAGSRYLSVGSDGTLYLCHRFAGDTTYAVGDVSAGVDRGRVQALLRGLKERARECASCWARWLCGGPCFYDLEASPSSSVGPNAPRCALRTRTFELSMWLYASLPPERRRQVVGAARNRSRPESVTGQVTPPGSEGDDAEARRRASL